MNLEKNCADRNQNKESHILIDGMDKVSRIGQLDKTKYRLMVIWDFNGR